ncbi:hypothetical protein F4780DRAFT_99049 [Xylariomycetidae sp. FL0641]|nr:hypothetical protein F4780DRAFT_99049 [Xylariomycetidae sp. FL0641]
MDGQPFLVMNQQGGRPPGPPLGPRPAGAAQPRPPPPPPPLNMIPADLRGGPPIQYCDISREFMSEADMLAQLTEYTVIRFEKQPCQEMYDDEGRYQRPTWARVIKIEDRGISPKEASRRIRHLDRTTASVLDKKKTLDPVLQRHIDHQMNQLMSVDPDLANYQWALVQIEHQLKPIVLPYTTHASAQYLQPRGHHYVQARGHHRSRKRQFSKKGGRHHKKVHGGRTAWERVAVTAYFKRMPRQNADITTLFHHKKQFQAMHANPMFQPPPNRQSPGAGGAGNRPPLGGPGPNRPPAGPPGGKGGLNGGGKSSSLKPRVVKSGPVRVVQNNRSESDTGSDYSSPGSGSRTSATLVSSASFKRERGQSYPVPGGAHVKQNANRGPGPAHPPPPPPRQPGLGIPSLPQHRYHPIQPSWPSSYHPPPAPPPSAAYSDIERVRENAYLEGMLHERKEAAYAEELAREAGRHRPRPHIVQQPHHHHHHRRRPGDRYHRHHHQGYSTDDTDDIASRMGRLGIVDSDSDAYDSDDGYGGVREPRYHHLPAGSVLDEDPFAPMPRRRRRSPGATTLASSSSYYPSAGEGPRRPPGVRRYVPRYIEVPERRYGVVGTPVYSPGVRRGRPSYAGETYPV